MSRLVKIAWLFLFLLLFGTAANGFAAISILSVNPVDGASSVALNTAITIRFDDNDMNSASIGAGSATTNSTGTFTVSFGGTPTYIGGNIVVVGGTAKFTPIANLTASTLYTCTMATGTTNFSSSSANGIAFSFTTGTSSDTSNTGVWYTDPLNNATGVAIDTQYVYVIFNERQDPSKVGSNTVAISTSAGAVSGNLNYYDYSTDYVGTPTAVFTPSGNLNYSTTYTITTDGVFDLAGNQIGTNTSTFTTVSAPVSDSYIPPKEKLEITNCYPKNDAYTITKIYAKFCMLINSNDINIVDGIDIGEQGGRKDEKFFALKDSWGNRIPGRTKGHGRNVIFTPDSELTLGEKYTATVKNIVRAANAAGTQMELDYNWTFTVSQEYGGEGD